MSPASEIPVLFTTYNRLDYTKKALQGLIYSRCGKIIVFDNNSTDGTQEWLDKLKSKKVEIIRNKKNEGVAGAMNYFFSVTRDCKWVAKVDNDTIVPKNWLEILYSAAEECKLDLIQAKHAILRQSYPSGDFDEWMKTLARDKINHNVYYSNHVGGTAVLIRRSVIDQTLQSDWVLGGWDKFQASHPDLKIAFYSGVEVTLLDTEGGSQKQKKYEDYYKETKRSNLTKEEIVQLLDKELKARVEEVYTLKQMLEESNEKQELLNTELSNLRNSRLYKTLIRIQKGTSSYKGKSG